MKICAPILALALLLAGCDGGRDGVLGGQPPGGGAAGGPVTWTICPGPQAQTEALLAFFEAREGDTIAFCEGEFDFSTGLIMTGKRGITVKGAGMDKTILSFASSTAQDGINVNQVDGFTIEDLTVYDAAGNGVRVFRSEHIIFRRVKIGWSNADPDHPNFDASMESWGRNGAYAFYPVVSRHILIEDSVSVGSSDAGVYIGQSSDILVRRTEAFHNVAGFEFENTYRAEYVDNIAHDNVGGFLVFDLPGRVQFGEKNLVHRNKAYSNNIPQFAPRGSIVAVIPPGTGMLVAAADQVEFYDNEIYDNRTVGLAIVNYGLADPNEPATNYDFFPEGMHVYNNVFRNNGYDPALPDTERSGCLGDPNNPIVGLPGVGENPECLADNATVLPTILVIKNAGKSAHIIWDGGEDVPNDCSSIPVDRDGIPLTEPNPNDIGRPEPRTDERGRPNFYQFDPIPECKWNAWKFDETGALKKPENGICIENNVFENAPTSPLIDDFANVHFSTPDPTDPANLVPADNTKPSDCPIVPEELLPQYQPVLPDFQPNPNADPRPTAAQIAAACGAGSPGRINMDAVLNYNCPRLDQYGLYLDETDPRAGPTPPGIPFDLNSILFSDYALKYRFLFLPPGDDGRPQKAGYQDSAQCTTLNIYDCYTATLTFPVGTVISKTFSFRDGENEDVVETRLLIKRAKRDGTPFWVGLPYRWTEQDGQRVALLTIEGSTESVSWDYDDPDPEVLDAGGNRKHYSGSTDGYAVPNAGACVLCHNGDDLEAGAPPIGPKVRNLNRDYDYADVGRMNQLAYMQMRGLLDLPDDPANLESMPRWDVPGSGGQTPNSPEDIHQRARAYLEVNCYHCHNPAGNAQNSGLVLDSFTNPMTQRQGICKPPVAAGRAADFGSYDIEPGNAQQSILPLRVATNEAGAAMPPLARSVAQDEVVELLMDWVDNVVADFADPDANSCGSSGAVLKIRGRPLMPHGGEVVPPTHSQEKPFG